jgi:tRNA-2-methylthio-N6-dimethylallyladenosine synthase
LGRIPGISWIRFITSHPRDFTGELAQAMHDNPAVCHQLHLPIQAGADPVLEAMNRGYTRAQYLDTVAALRALMPDIALSTDIIVGFPGETERDFRQTLDVLQTVRFTNIFSFRYSPRPRTAAARRLIDDVPQSVKKERLLRVQDLQKKIQWESHRSMIGSVSRVLCSGPSKKGRGRFSGRNSANQVVNFFAAGDPTGKFASVRITGCGPYSLLGEEVRS